MEWDRRTLLLIAASCSLSFGCTRHPRNEYAAPVGLAPASAATIFGSKLSVPGLLSADIRVVVSAVDGRRTATSSEEWARPILVAPGSHLFQFAATNGNGAAPEIATRISLEPGRTYQLRFGRAEHASTAAIWLEDAETGLPVGEKIEVTTGLADLLSTE